MEIILNDVLITCREREKERKEEADKRSNGRAILKSGRGWHLLAPQGQLKT